MAKLARVNNARMVRETLRTIHPQRAHQLLVYLENLIRKDVFNQTDATRVIEKLKTHFPKEARG